MPRPPARDLSTSASCTSAGVTASATASKYLQNGVFENAEVIVALPSSYHTFVMWFATGPFHPLRLPRLNLRYRAPSGEDGAAKWGGEP